MIFIESGIAVSLPAMNEPQKSFVKSAPDDAAPLPHDDDDDVCEDDDDDDDDDGVEPSSLNSTKAEAYAPAK